MSFLNGFGLFESNNVCLIFLMLLSLFSFMHSNHKEVEWFLFYKKRIKRIYIFLI